MNIDITTLTHQGTVRIATLPPANWHDNDPALFLTTPLIAEDYPAKTAVMWNAAYAAFDMYSRNMMLVANPKDLAEITRVFRSDSRYQGGGAGVGFKEAIIPYLDDVTPLAKAMGAVNIVKKVDNRLVGDNTDGVGYARSLEALLLVNGIPLTDAHVIILGAGGSGRAIAFALADGGARLSILNRTEAKSRELADTVNRYFKTNRAFGGGRDVLPEIIRDAHAIVSVIDDAESPLDAYATIGDMVLPVTDASIEQNRLTTEKLLENVPRSVIISDIRIRKGPTAMLAQAQALGFTTLDGIPMVVNQGVAAFWWLYGDTLTVHGVTQADVTNVMRDAAGL
ncbi:MAG TPA: hypothetical protein VMV38_01900 [Candidatus Paceibacterota bacterium]|nr:hypothetical protein [Candidatus Paceibacterota bacterium]